MTRPRAAYPPSEDPAMKTSLDSQLSSLLPQGLFHQPPNQGIQERYRAQSQDMAISLTTKEGDRITIHQSLSVAHQQLNLQGAGSRGTVAQGTIESGLTVELEGDLNHQEMADLVSLFRDLSGIAANFFSGKLDQAVTAASEIGDMGSFTALEATFSQTSILSQYLQVPHPLPATVDLIPTDLLLTETSAAKHGHDADPPRTRSHALPALWQQILGAIGQLDSLTTRPAATNGEQSAAEAGSTMLTRSRETLAQHPRLSPLLPSVASLAVEQTAKRIGQGLSLDRLTKELDDSFTKAFNDWVV